MAPMTWFFELSFLAVVPVGGLVRLDWYLRERLHFFSGFTSKLAEDPQPTVTDLQTGVLFCPREYFRFPESGEPLYQPGQLSRSAVARVVRCAALTYSSSSTYHQPNQTLLWCTPEPAAPTPPYR
jgi:hypothetical protein